MFCNLEAMRLLLIAWANTVLFPHETGSETGQNLHVEEAKLGDC